jgi:glutathione S-transferase
VPAASTEPATGEPTTAKLYVISGSHACRTGMLLLEHKGIAHEKVEIPTGLHPFAMRLRGFPGSPAPFRLVDGRPGLLLRLADRLGTVPALRVDGRRVQTNREIARYLDERQPEPPLFPADPERRREVEEAENWGDEVFQMAARRLVLAAAAGGLDGLNHGGQDGRLGALLWHKRAVRRTGTRLVARVFRANRRAEGELLTELPAMLDRIDAWIEAGVLNGEELNAADYMIVTSLALLCYRPDLRPEIEGRPSVALLDRVLPEPDVVHDPRR